MRAIALPEFSQHVVVGHRSGTLRTIETKVTTAGTSAVADEGFNAIGTTDTRYEGDPDKYGVLRKDVSPRVAARALWGALDGVALTWALGTPDRAPDPASLRKAATQLALIFLDGLRVRD